MENISRRDLIKSLGLSVGIVSSSGVLLSTLSGCEKKLDQKMPKDPELASNGVDLGSLWQPRFFTPIEGLVLITLVDTLLPKSDTPSGTEVGTHQFIDQFVNEVVVSDDRIFFKKSIMLLAKQVLSIDDKRDISNIIDADISAVLDKLFKKDHEKNRAAYANYVNTKKSGKTAVVSDDAFLFGLLKDIRKIAILGYRNNEKIAEGVLVYVPIPGKFEPCADVKDVTGGLKYALD